MSLTLNYRCDSDVCTATAQVICAYGTHDLPFGWAWLDMLDANGCAFGRRVACSEECIKDTFNTVQAVRTVQITRALPRLSA